MAILSPISQVILSGTVHHRLREAGYQIASLPHVSGTVLVDHRSTIEALRARDTGRIFNLHQESNRRIFLEMTELLSVQENE